MGGHSYTSSLPQPSSLTAEHELCFSVADEECAKRQLIAHGAGGHDTMGRLSAEKEEEEEERRLAECSPGHSPAGCESGVGLGGEARLLVSL